MKEKPQFKYREKTTLESLFQLRLLKRRQKLRNKLQEIEKACDSIEYKKAGVVHGAAFQAEQQRSKFVKQADEIKLKIERINTDLELELPLQIAASLKSNIDVDFIDRNKLNKT